MYIRTIEWHAMKPSRRQVLFHPVMSFSSTRWLHRLARVAPVEATYTSYGILFSGAAHNTR